MAFDFYYTGVPAESPVANFIRDKNACILLSQLNERSNINKWIEKLKINPQSKCKLFIDSGAFSAWTKGKYIDVDEYINFINTNKEYFYICASVDYIPGKPRSSEIASEEEVRIGAQKTWDNYLYMRSKMEDVNKLLYTFHCGEPWEYLKTALNYEDEKGKINYIAFGGLVGKNTSVLKGFLEEAFKIIKNSSNPDVKVHAFGMTRLQYLEEYPFTSADSTSWLQTANFGNIIIGNKSFCVSDRKLLDDDNILNKNPAILNAVKTKALQYGINLEDLLQNTEARLLFNVYSCQEWADNYVYREILGQKCSLW